MEKDHNHEKDKNESISWARKVLGDPNSVILDLETTGLGTYPDNRIVQISIVNMDGLCLLSAVINPGVPIPAAVSKIHGIENRHVKSLPFFSEVEGFLSKVISGKNVICYNNSFDITLLVGTYKGEGFPLPFFTEECCLDYYSAYVGEWNGKHKDYKFKKLPHLAYGKAHDALNDCLSTLEVIKIMAGQTTTDSKEEFNLDF